MMTNQEIKSIGDAFCGTFSHACVVVKDIHKTIGAYQALLGSGEPPRLKQTGAPEEAHVVYKGQPTPARAYQTFFTVGGLRIEVLQLTSIPAPGRTLWTGTAIVFIISPTMYPIWTPLLKRFRRWVLPCCKPAPITGANMPTWTARACLASCWSC